MSYSNFTSIFATRLFILYLLYYLEYLDGQGGVLGLSFLEFLQYYLLNYYAEPKCYVDISL